MAREGRRRSRVASDVMNFRLGALSLRPGVLLNGRDVLTVFPVALIAAPNLDLEELHRMRPCVTDDADLTAEVNVKFTGRA